MQQVNKEKTKRQTCIPEIHTSRKGTTLCSTVQTTVQTDSLFGKNTLFANAQGINVFANAQVIMLLPAHVHLLWWENSTTVGIAPVARADHQGSWPNGTAPRAWSPRLLKPGHSVHLVDPVNLLCSL